MIGDTISNSQLASCKHANGRDWWIIQPKYLNDKYSTILLDSLGLNVMFEQKIGGIMKPRSDGGGNACFTPDGRKYLRYASADSLFIFDFDRKTGMLSNYKLIPVEENFNFGIGTVSVSGSSRFAYVNTFNRLYQYDLLAADIKGSEVIVGEYDGFLDPFPTYFYRSMLAPDCRIYMVTWNSSTILHLIQYPDNKGLACGFKQHAIQLPNRTSNRGTIQYFPNYRLGTTPTYPCDSTIKLMTPLAEIVLPEVNFLVYPNPASSEVNIIFETEKTKKGMLMITNMMGQVMTQKAIESNVALKVDVSTLPNGLYSVALNIDGSVVKSSKFLILK